MKRKLAVWIVCGVVLCGAAFAWRLGSRGGSEKGVLLKPEQDVAVGKVIAYEQRDEAWKEDKLGDSVYSMGSSGCLTSCIASALSTEQENFGTGSIVTAGELNRLFGEKQVYNGSGDIVWGKIQEALPETETVVASSVDQEEIQKLLLQGHYPIIKVKVGGNGASHWVMLAGSEDGQYLCMDPLQEDGKLVPLSVHGGTAYRMRCVYWAE